MVSLLLLVSMAEAKKPKTPPPPPQGWAREEGWKGDCYFPKDFSALPEGDRRMLRQTVLQEIEGQWRGSRNDGVTMSEEVVEALDTVLLSKPAMVEQVVVGNLEQCKAFRAGGDLSAWEGYLRGLPSILKKGDCTTPLSATYFNYLDITTGWQQPIHICKGNKAHIFATASDKFRIVDNGPWINVLGDPAGGAADPQFPCHGDPQCLPGMLMGRFVTDEGVEVIFVVGADTVFTAPENGTLSVGINDYQWYDNKWFKSATIEDRAAITVEPAN